MIIVMGFPYDFVCISENSGLRASKTSYFRCRNKTGVEILLGSLLTIGLLE